MAKKRHFFDGRSTDTMAYTLNVAEDGIFMKVGLENVGFSDYILECFKDYDYTCVADIIQWPPCEIHEFEGLEDCVKDVLDTLDEFFYNFFELYREKYMKNPVPVYHLLQLEDTDPYRNYMLYDLHSHYKLSIPDKYLDPIRESGIVTLLDFLKTDLMTIHGIIKITDSDLRFILNRLRTCVLGIQNKPEEVDHIATPLEQKETFPITYPLPKDAKEKVSALICERMEAVSG